MRYGYDYGIRNITKIEGERDREMQNPKQKMLRTKKKKQKPPQVIGCITISYD